MSKINATPLSEGNKVPVFNTSDDSGFTYSNENLLGSNFIIYFYPRDNTPGCTMQACDIRDSFNELKKIPIKILGVSGCSMLSHKKFKSKNSLPFPLLMDEDHKLAKAFGVWGEKKFMGKTYDGIHRTTFIISAKGMVLKVYSKVKPKSHLIGLMDDLSVLL